MLQKTKLAEGKSRQRALVVCIGGLGDVVWASASIDALRETYRNDIEIDLLLKHRSGDLFRDDPRISRVLILRGGPRLPLLVNPYKWLILSRALLRYPYHLILDLTINRTDFFPSLSWFFPTAHKVKVYKVRQEVDPPDTHRTTVIQRLLAYCIPDHIARRAMPSLRRPDIDIRMRFGLEAPFICLHTGNSSFYHNRANARLWPVERWVGLLEGWSRFFPHHQPLLIGTPAEAKHVAQIAGRFPGVVNLCGKTSLPEMMALIADSDLLIGTDTGPTHVAAAFRTPVIAIFGPTLSHVTGPAGDSGDMRIVKPLAGTRIEDVQVGQVVSASYELIASREALRRAAQSAPTQAANVADLRPDQHLIRLQIKEKTCHTKTSWWKRVAASAWSR
ncbi:glycosyltransferase family 9 protein [Cupriavidus sp. WKF15]|uniref:glycosyltransferase family 9 protein n=1 Tax=Cupriavidus sp. WKF15 TaxID=3032282 RepID=UPI0023E16DA2|nr:glycosyltransferase family 9 protein [Cupriavidus sp. WKF15]WER45589.1 glycosyltransferase family 9 protein [Cupriavidus sp. WKF15]